MKKIGIMGGTFNPIHNAHLILAQAALSQFDLDEIMFLPSGQPAYKNLSELESDEVRLMMVTQAIAENEKFTVSDMELNRSGNTYTADTLLELTKFHPNDKYFFILGGDSLLYLKKWSRPEVILSHAVILAASRSNLDDEMIQKEIDFLNQNFAADVRYLKVPNLEISSHMLRLMCSEKKSIRYYVPESVYHYITAHDLYR